MSKESIMNREQTNESKDLGEFVQSKPGGNGISSLAHTAPCEEIPQGPSNHGLAGDPLELPPGALGVPRHHFGNQCTRTEVPNR